MKVPFAVLFAVTAAVGMSASAQTYERVLIPIIVSDAAGTQGSLWKSDLWVHNADSKPHRTESNIPCVTGACGGLETIQPFTTVVWDPAAQPADNPGVVIYVEEPTDPITFYLRVWDVSRDPQTFGTEIRVVREREALTGPAYLINVPLLSRFRVTLRVYEMEGNVDSRVRVRAYSLAPPTREQTLAQVDLSLLAPVRNVNTLAKFKPSYAQINDVAEVFPTITEKSIGIEVAPLTPGLRYWTFVTVTDNVNQQVTTISPNTLIATPTPPSFNLGLGSKKSDIFECAARQ